MMGWLTNLLSGLSPQKNISVEQDLPTSPPPPKALVISAAFSEGAKKWECPTCKLTYPLPGVVKTAERFYFYPGPGFSKRDLVPLLPVVCPICKAQSYLAIHPEYVETGIFAGSPTLDLIPVDSVSSTLPFEFSQEIVPTDSPEQFVVPVDDGYYERVYLKAWKLKLWDINSNEA